MVEQALKLHLNIQESKEEAKRRSKVGKTFHLKYSEYTVIIHHAF
jgi:hypothetical protein